MKQNYLRKIPKALQQKSWLTRPLQQKFAHDKPERHPAGDQVE